VTLTTEQVEVSADPRAQYDAARAERWSDGAPLLPATDDAINALLAATPYPSDHALCVLPPSNGVATIELIAVNAAMAGCEPAAFPFVVAALEAISEPEWNAFGLTTTTSSVFPMLLVNGPCRDELEICLDVSSAGELAVGAHAEAEMHLRRGHLRRKLRRGKCLHERQRNEPPHHGPISTFLERGKRTPLPPRPPRPQSRSIKKSLRPSRALRLNVWSFLKLLFLIGGGDDGLHPAPHGKIAHHGHAARLNGGDQIVEDLVGDVFVENAAVSEFNEVVLERLQLDALSVGDVGDPNLTEIGQPGLRAHRRELWTADGDFEVALRAWIEKRLDG